MESVKKLIGRFWLTGVLFLVGFLLIIYIAFGFLYLQQDAKQKELGKQITNVSAVLARQLPSGEELQAECDNVTIALAPKLDKYYIKELVGIAEESGIDIDEASGKLRIPSATLSQTKVGGGTYQLISFKNIRVQGDHDKVMAFISDLDSGKTRENMVLTRVATSEIEVIFGGEEGDRRAEFRKVASAVIDLMIDNELSAIPNPMSFAGGVATKLMGDDPDTEEVVEGFPDTITTAAEKGYSGNVTPRDGYVLYNHDKIFTDNTTQYGTVSYLSTLTTKYYYTCEADGTVLQWNGPDVATAGEYLSSEESKIETVTTVSVDIYTKPEG